MKNQFYSYKDLNSYKILYKPNDDYSKLEKLKLLNFYMDYSTQNKNAKVLWGLYKSTNNEIYPIEFLVHQTMDTLTMLCTLKNFYTKADLKQGRFSEAKKEYLELTRASLKDLN